MSNPCDETETASLKKVNETKSVKRALSKSSNLGRTRSLSPNPSRNPSVSPSRIPSQNQEFINKMKDWHETSSTVQVYSPTKVTHILESKRPICIEVFSWMTTSYKDQIEVNILVDILETGLFENVELLLDSILWKCLYILPLHNRYIISLPIAFCLSLFTESPWVQSSIKIIFTISLESSNELQCNLANRSWQTWQQWSSFTTSSLLFAPERVCHEVSREVKKGSLQGWTRRGGWGRGLFCSIHFNNAT